MKNKLLATLMVGFVPLIVVVDPLMNLDSLKKEVIQYHKSDTYNNEVSKITHQAENYLARRGFALIKNLRIPKNWLLYWILMKRHFLIIPIFVH